MEEKFKLDVWYMDYVSIGADVKAFFARIKAVLWHEDISGEAEIMTEFMGVE